MTTNEDLMKFLLSMKEEHAKERKLDKEEWKEMRERERQEDRAEMEKVVDLKVTEAIKPFEEKTETVVQAQQQMKKQVDNLTGLLMGLKDKVENSSGVMRNENSPNSDISTTEPVTRQSQLGGAQVVVVGRQEHSEGLSEIISEARRTVGLYRIDNSDLQRMRQEQYGGAQTEYEEKLLAVREYLKGELKIDTETIKRMDIEKMFFLRKDNPECMYVTFKCRSSVSKIFEKTYIMRRESRVQTYIPREFKERARAISEFEYELREREKCKTKVRMGFYDLQVFKKNRSGGKWELVPLTGVELPPVDLSMSQSPSRPVTTSPPPGRPGQKRPEKRDRESAGSPSSNLPKSSKQDYSTDEEQVEVKDDTEHNDFTKALENADLVTDTTPVSPSKDGAVLKKKPDLGTVMSISGTPVKLSQTDISLVNSPIFSRHGKN